MTVAQLRRYLDPMRGDLKVFIQINDTSLDLVNIDRVRMVRDGGENVLVITGNKCLFTAG